MFTSVVVCFWCAVAWPIPRFSQAQMEVEMNAARAQEGWRHRTGCRLWHFSGGEWSLLQDFVGWILFSSFFRVTEWKMFVRFFHVCCFGSTIEWDWREIQAPLKHEPWDHGSSCFCLYLPQHCCRPTWRVEKHTLTCFFVSNMISTQTSHSGLTCMANTWTVHIDTLHYITHFPGGHSHFFMSHVLYIPPFLLVKYPAFNAALPLHTYEPIQLTVDSH